jgi:hypothetical protein
VAHHAETAGIINDDEVGAAFFDEFRADARACAGGDDRLAFRERVVETLDTSVRV